MALPPPPVQVKDTSSVVWKDWLYKIQQELAKISHNNLRGLQGGTTDEYYHLSSSEHAQASVLRNTSSTNTFVAWNPDDTGGIVTLSNSNKTVTFGTSCSSYSGVRADFGIASGKYYFEMIGDGVVGIADINASIQRAGTGDFFYDDAPNQGYLLGTAQVVYQGSSIITGLSPKIETSSDVVGIALDMDNKQLWVSINNTWQTDGVLSPDPSTLTDPIVSSIVTDTYYPVVMGCGTNDQETLRTLSADLSYSAPTGFSLLPTIIEISENSFLLQLTGGDAIVLPSTSTWDGRILVVKKVDAGTSATVYPSEGQTIDGEGSITLSGQYDFVVVQKVSNSWYIIGRYESGEFTDATADAISFNRRYTLMLT